MTIIKDEVEVKVRTLMDAGLTGYKIAKQLNLKMTTVFDFLKKVHLYGSLPPKIKMYKGKIQGPMQINIKLYLFENPTATPKQIIFALNLAVVESTLCVYLKKYGLDREIAKREVLLSQVNRAKRLVFAKTYVLTQQEKEDKDKKEEHINPEVSEEPKAPY